MEHNIKISIVTAVLNRVNTLEQMLESILCQTYDNIEIIIIDGGSTDGTCDILKKYSDQIAYWVSESDNGIYDALNKGIKKATGDFIEVLGADDSLCDKFVIEKVVNNITNQTDIISGCQWVVDERYNRQYFNSNKFARNSLKYHGGMIPHGSMFVKRNILLKNSFDSSYKIVGDYKFFLQCYYDKNINFVYIDLPVTYFSLSGISSNDNARIREDQLLYRELGISFSRFKNKKINTLIKIIKKFIKSSLLFKFLYSRYYQWYVLTEHKCDNPRCRWCRQHKA